MIALIYVLNILSKNPTTDFKKVFKILFLLFIFKIKNVSVSSVDNYRLFKNYVPSGVSFVKNPLIN
jgi:hypothetical protein